MSEHLHMNFHATADLESSDPCRDGLKVTETIVEKC